MNSSVKIAACLLGLVHISVGLFFPSPCYSGRCEWMSPWSLHPRIRRDVTNDTGPWPCRQVIRCYLSLDTGPYNVLSRFNVREVYQTFSQLCENPSSEIHTRCWDDGCDDQYLRSLIQHADRIMSRICVDLDSFERAAVCDQEPLCWRLRWCSEEALKQEVDPNVQSNRNTFLNFTSNCVDNAIDSLPEPCADENKDFLKSFFNFVIESRRELWAQISDAETSV